VDNKIIITDRYGGNWPDPETVCKGQCDGMGFYPVQASEVTPDMELRDDRSDLTDELGYVFVTCETCGGTGRRNTE
jgi:hypothetical protein